MTKDRVIKELMYVLGVVAIVCLVVYGLGGLE